MCPHHSWCTWEVRLQCWTCPGSSRPEGGRSTSSRRCGASPACCTPSRPRGPRRGRPGPGCTSPWTSRGAWTSSECPDQSEPRLGCTGLTAWKASRIITRLGRDSRQSYFISSKIPCCFSLTWSTFNKILHTVPLILSGTPWHGTLGHYQ